MYPNETLVRKRHVKINVKHCYAVPSPILIILHGVRIKYQALHAPQYLVGFGAGRISVCLRKFLQFGLSLLLPARGDAFLSSKLQCSSDLSAAAAVSLLSRKKEISQERVNLGDFCRARQNRREIWGLQ